MKQKDCCQTKTKKNKGFLSGVMFGIIPHFFCIAFIFFSIIGAVAATTFFRKFMLIPNLFFFLTVASLIMATISAIIYLKKRKSLFLSGIKNNWKYLTSLYAATLLVNLFMFFIVFPALANIELQKIQNQTTNGSSAILSINVQIPCSGHAPLVINEIKNNCDVESIAFSLPNAFTIKYDPKKVTPEKIVSLDIFKTYPLKIN